jgi:hypothetical protein
VIKRAGFVLALSCCLLLGWAASSLAAMPPIKHVFVLVEENESEATTFGPTSPAPYLSKTLVSQGAYLSNYYGVGHSSLDNYIAMVSGQAPNPATQADCGTFGDFTAPTSIDASGQETGQGCVYPANVPTLMGQLVAKGLTWRAYEDGMGADPTREAATCGHPALGSVDHTEAATPTDQYATRHDPFVYFHSVIDNRPYCGSHVVNLSKLPGDLSRASRTPNFVFITPNLCDDGHDAVCANGGPGGLAQVDTFLKAWVPTITSSPAFKQGGLLLILFDEAVGDASACCGEVPGPYDAAHGIQPGGYGPGGGLVGAVLLSPYIKAGTKTATPYNHYSMLGSVEDLFGLPRLAEATGTRAFGADVFTQKPPQISALKLKPGFWSHKHPGTSISYADSETAKTKFVVDWILRGYRSGHAACKALKPHRLRPAHSAPCSIARLVGTFSHADAAGLNHVHFNGRIRGRALVAGSYELQVTPTLGSLIGKTKTVKFRIR